MAEVRKRFDLELVFVWNRNSSVLYGEVDPALILENLDDFNTLYVFCVSVGLKCVCVNVCVWLH